MSTGTGNKRQFAAGESASQADGERRLRRRQETGGARQDGKTGLRSRWRGKRWRREDGTESRWPLVGGRPTREICRVSKRVFNWCSLSPSVLSGSEVASDGRRVESSSRSKRDERRRERKRRNRIRCSRLASRDTRTQAQTGSPAGEHQVAPGVRRLTAHARDAAGVRASDASSRSRSAGCPVVGALVQECSCCSRRSSVVVWLSCPSSACLETRRASRVPREGVARA